MGKFVEKYRGLREFASYFPLVRKIENKKTWKLDLFFRGEFSEFWKWNLNSPVQQRREEIIKNENLMSFPMQLEDGWLYSAQVMNIIYV